MKHIFKIGVAALVATTTGQFHEAFALPTLNYKGEQSIGYFRDV